MAPEFVFPDPGVPTIPLERLEIGSEHAARYVAESRPFVSKVNWPVLAWTPDYLRQKVGNAKVKMLKRTREMVEIPLRELFDFVDAQRSGSDEYVIQNSPSIRIWGYDGPNPELEPLLADIPLPAFIPRERVNGMYIWAKNVGWYDNGSHCEPNASAAINLQIRGKKHVWMFPPEDAGLLGAASSREEMMGPPFFSAAQTVYRPSEEHPEFANIRCYEAVLEPGDVIHIPTFWYHWFVHYDEYQLNYNCWFTRDAVTISPVAAEWAYMNALCQSLGGFDAATAAFEGLPIETQKLLNQIARNLINDRRCSNPHDYYDLKRGSKKMEFAPTVYDTGKK
jgi:hypothetical protein